MTIDELCEAVMKLKPNNFMALNGAAAGILGSSDSGTDAIAQLQQATLRFALVYRDGSLDELDAAKREVIGKTMVAMTMDSLTEEKADMIAEAVTEIAKGKK